MGIFGSKNHKDQLALVFDVGSSSVGGALFWMRKSGVPKIIFSYREPIVLEKKIDIDKFLSLTINSLETVVNKIHMSGLGAPKVIFCTLSSPWYVSQTRVIKLEKNVPFLFTTKLADDLIQKEITFFEQEHLAQYINTKNPVQPIELKNIKTMLNGYETSNPLNQKAKELEMTIFISMSPEQILKNIKDTIHKSFHGQDIKFSSLGLTSFAVVRDMYINQENFLLIDVGGEVTDISMIKKNILRESISFSLGTNFMIRGIASSLLCSLAEAKSCLSLFKDGHAAESMRDKIQVVLNKLKSEWLVHFQKSLAGLSNDISIPATIFLSMNRDLADFFSQIIKTEQFNQYTLTESNFKIIYLGTEVFHRLAEFEENTIRDTGLIIDSIYINRFLN